LTLALGTCANPSPPCGACTVTGVLPNAGVLQNRRCRGDATGANGSWIACTSDADCPGAGNACVFFFGPPRPGDKGLGVLCTTTEIGAGVSGTVGAEDGSVGLAVPATFRTHTAAEPCPTCVGGTCNAGPRAGMPCAVQGTSASFDAGVSLDCPPNAAGTLVHSQSVVLSLGTGTQTKTLTAASPNCRAGGWAASKCFCDTCNDLNAEPCSSDADCPISGGNPGVCGGRRCLDGTNAGNPCVTGADCPSGSCGRPGEATAPNGCDDGVCTPNTPPDVDSVNEGTCAAGPVGGFCAIETWRACLSGADCPLSGDSCVPTTRECYPDNGVVGASVTAAGVASPTAPTLAAMYCGTPSGNSPTLNVLRSYPGLVRMTLPGTATFGY
jgi:hypothetical protein